MIVLPDDPEFENDADRGDCDSDMEAYEHAASEMCFEKWFHVPLRGKWKLWRGIKRKAWAKFGDGETDPHAVAASIVADINNDEDEYGSILLIIGIHVLSQVVAFFVTRLLERWFKRGLA